MEQFERLGRAHAGRRHPEIFFDIVGRLLGKLHAVKLGAAVETPQQVRQRLAEMAEHHLGAGKAIEQPAEYQPQGMRAGLETPFPSGAAQAVIALEHGRGHDRIGGMNVDRRAERLGPLPERMQRRMVEILAVGVAVDHGAGEFEVAHATFQLVGGAARILHRQMRKAGIAVGALLHLARQKIIGFAGAAERSRGIAFALHARTGDRQAPSARSRPRSMACSRISPKSVSRARSCLASLGSTLATVGRQ